MTSAPSTGNGQAVPNAWAGPDPAAAPAGLDHDRKGEWPAGWRVVASASVGAGLGWHIFISTASLFIIPMQTEFGWSRAAVSIAPIIGLASAFMNPLAGLLIDRSNTKKIAVLGLGLLCIGLVMLAMTPSNPFIFYAVAAYIAVIGSITNTMLYTKGVATWFRRNVGSAIGVMMCGMSLVSALAIPILSHIVVHYGWRTGYLAMALAVACIGLPAVILWFGQRPGAQHGPTSKPETLPGTSVAGAVRDRRFWILVAFLSCGSPPVGGFLSQLQPLLISHEFTASSAAGLVVVYAIVVAVGRITVGLLLDLLRPALVASACMALAAVGAFTLATLGSGPLLWWTAFVAVFLLAMAHGAEGDFLAFFSLRLFGLKSYAALYGILAVVMGSGVSIGGIAFAMAFDHYGSYEPAIYCSVAMLCCASMLGLLLKVPPKETHSG